MRVENGPGRQSQPFLRLPWWSTVGAEAWRILGMEKPMSSSVSVSSFIT